MARLPRARRTSSSATPASINAPSTMSPDAPEKQSKYRTRTTGPSYPSTLLSVNRSALSTRQLPRFDERVVPLVGENQMVEHVDPNHVTRTHQPGGQRHVVGARARITRRVIVKEHDRRRPRGDRLTKHLPRVGDGRVDRAG